MPDRIDHFREKVDQFPANPLFKFSLGQELFENNMLDEAIIHFNACLVANPNWMMAALFLAKSHQAAGNKELAIENFQRTIRLAQDQNHDDPLAEAEDMLSELLA